MNPSSAQPTSIAYPMDFTYTNFGDGPDYLVPTALIPAMDHAAEKNHMKRILQVYQSLKSSQSKEPLPSVAIAAGSVMVPAIPGSTERELIALHAEVLALQKQYGLSYKDAAHRLYLAEVKVLAARDTAFTSLSSLASKALTFTEEDIIRSIADIDSRAGRITYLD